MDEDSIDKSEIDRTKELIDWDEEYFQAIAGKKPDAKYGALSEAVRHAIPETKICSMFCGGKKCKYCNPALHYKDESMAIKGLFSHWVTENILATSRPSTELIEKYDIINQFKEAGIKSIINLQQPGEHASCGAGCENGEFSYKPQDFMDNDIFFYNFGWPDLSVPESYYKVLDMCKVLQYAISEGRVALHCHAGKGRTGVLIACYLVYANRMDADDVVHYIRSKRPGAIQTRNQVTCINEFAQFLQPLRVVFSSVHDDAFDFGLTQFLHRQRSILHGVEARQLKYIPKIVQQCCLCLLKLAGREIPHRTLRDSLEVVRASAPGAFHNTRLSKELNALRSSSALTSSGSSPSLARNVLLPKKSKSDQNVNKRMALAKSRSVESFTAVDAKLAMERNANNSQSSLELTPTSSDPELPLMTVKLSSRDFGTELAQKVGHAMAATEYPPEVIERITSFKLDLNEDCAATWHNLWRERDPRVVAGLLWDWLDHLKEPVLHPQDMPSMLDSDDDPVVGLAALEKGARSTVEYLFATLAQLTPLPGELEAQVVQRLLSTLTHQNMVMEPLTVISPSQRSLLKRTSNLTGIMRDSVARRLHFFFLKLIGQLSHAQQMISKKI